MNVELSVIVPAYNEAERIGPSLERVVDYLRQPDGDAPFEVLVVDDGSTDGTADLVRSLEVPEIRVLVQPQNRGKGAALQRGVSASVGRQVLISDADLSTPIEDVERLRDELKSEVGGRGEADIVIGSRALASSDIAVRQPFYRVLMGKTFNRIIRTLGVSGFHDTQCGFKMFSGEAARDLFPRLKTDGFAFDVELLWLAKRRGYRIREVGVRWADALGSRVHPVLDSFAMLRDVLLMRWRHRRS